MPTDIFLIAPMNARTDTFPALLDEILAAGRVSALFLPRDSRTEAEYEALVKSVIPVAQERDCAVLVDNDPDLARRLGADGVHMTLGMKAFQHALDTLKPDMIVGAGDLNSHHEAMLRGEAGADYLFFGAVSGSVPEDARADAEWWAETFEVPAVWCDPDADPSAADSAGCEFLGLSDSFWALGTGAPAMLGRLNARMDAPR